MLIKNATDLHGQRLDLRTRGRLIAAIGDLLPPEQHETVIDAGGALLLPGLHDHHIHLQALAAARASVNCGPPVVNDRAQLANALRRASARLPDGKWLRGVAYHESVAGELGRELLDAWVPERPLRIQHRTGRLWMFNSAAREQLLATGADVPPEHVPGLAAGRLYDADVWLRQRLNGRRPDLGEVSRELAAYGITGVTDTSHDNDMAALAYFTAEQHRGALLQNLRVMGNAELDAAPAQRETMLATGEHKFHLHEHELPDFDRLCAAIRASHGAGRGVAFHCVTRTELVFALQALREAGSRGHDRIEHAAITPPELLADMQALAVTVVTQPNFVAERGAAYLRDVEAQEQPHLYRLRSFSEAGIGLAAGSDAPYGEVNPWAAMQAAVARQTGDGRPLGQVEALTPEQALALFLAPLDQPGGAPRRLQAGAAASLCLLEQSWEELSRDLAAARISLTCINGNAVQPA